ncbi:hypothetical protein [Streptomyces sp. HNM0574]|uniref:hypothetical protein n=1 Tax=Streptomyces sp. HNM0574 TaxID=2714954 RepID=UPI00146B3F14|nr:hypothetical protein [Streptomyces sp. HNM0574]NLU66841.1 hypothetical protein [Streptomyces sp. HNM0574]
MSAVFAVPAAVRMPRSAGARRALLTALFLGALFALGLLFGGSAQAASTTSALPGSDGTSLVDTEADTAPRQVRPVQAVREADERTTREIGAHRQRSSAAAGEAVDEVTEPVTEQTDGARRVTRPVGEAVNGVVERADLGETVDGVLPGGDAEHAEGGHRDDRHDRAAKPAHKDAPDRSAAHDGAFGPHAGADAATTLPASALPDGTAVQAVADDGRSGPGGPLPGPHLPSGQTPCLPGQLSTSSGQSAGDGHGGSRGGVDQLAAYLSDSERFGLPQPGAVRAADGTPTRERAAEILEFPG